MKSQLVTTISQTLLAAAVLMRNWKNRRLQACETLLGNGRLRRFILGVSLLMSVAMPARSTLVFRPVGRGPEVFAFNGVTMSAPLASNPYALNSPTVYFIFVGPNFVQNGSPTNALNSMVSSAKAILGSSYLSGLKQYGSNGLATYGAYAIDTGFDPTINPSQNPVWTETQKILSNPQYASWGPPGPDARTSPIYVQVRYQNNGVNIGGSYGGSNDFGPNGYTSLPINVIDVSITSVDQVDQFSWVFSHEVAERMSAGISSGTVGLSEVSPDAGGQIADGEPEGNQFYAWRLNGPTGPVVTSYWSVIDQGFIIPDGTLNRFLVVPVWSGGSWTGNFVSLQKGSLYQMKPSSQQILIDTNVQSYVIVGQGANGQIFELTATGQVRLYSGSGTNWTLITSTNVTATSLVTTTDGRLYMLAQNRNQPAQA